MPCRGRQNRQACSVVCGGEMFLRRGVEYDVGRALGLLSLATLAPFIVVLGCALVGCDVDGLPGRELALAAAATGVVSGWAALLLLARVYAEWQLRPPLVVIGTGCGLGLSGLAGTLLTPPVVAQPWPALAMGAAICVTLALVWRLRCSVRPTGDEST